MGKALAKPDNPVSSAIPDDPSNPTPTRVTKTRLICVKLERFRGGGKPFDVGVGSGKVIDSVS